MTRVLLHGAGRMARRILAHMSEFPDFELAGLVSRSRPDELPATAEWFASLDDIQGSADLLIDFTLPGGTQVAADWCARNCVALLSGTTGLDDEDINALKNAALKVPVLWAPNMSHGVAVMSALVRQAAATLGLSANTSINDIHHKHKLDAPSGTALALAAAVMEGRSEHLQDLTDSGDSELVFSNVRKGEVIGEHTVSFGLPDEVIEITHKALDRQVFAKGALKAAEWLAGQSPGYYSTQDWLELD